MRIDKISLKNTYKPNTPVVACIGFFDGVHRGHRELIQAAVDLSKELGCASGLISFEPDPWVTVKGMKLEDCEHLTTTKQKINLVSGMGIQNVYLLDFTPEMSQLSDTEFVANVLGQLNLKGLICGFDFHFGRKGEGDARRLQELLNCPVRIIEEVTEGGTKISSSRIVECVKEGDFLGAYKLLGHPFAMDGKIVHGQHVGTGLGFPTANVACSPEYVTPKLGVYSGHVKVRGKTYGAMINVGHNPTVNYTSNISIEAHLFHFDYDIYNEYVSVIFEQYIRPEIQFKTRDNLIMQLESDRQKVMRALGIQ